MQQTLAERAGVTYATVGRGKRVHYSPRNDETLCNRITSEYLDVVQASELLDEKGFELCTHCVRAAEKRAQARSDAAPVEQVDAAQAPEWRTLKGAVTPFRIHTRNGNPLGRKASPTDETMTIVDMRFNGGVRHGTTADGDEVMLWGAATRYWVSPGAPQQPAALDDQAENDAPRYKIETYGTDQAGVWDIYTIEWAVEQTTLAEAEQIAARLNREHAEARAAGPIVFRFDSTGEAYDATQTRDHIRDGDVLVIEREQVVGFLVNAWPCAITAAHGELHGCTTDSIDPRTIDDGKYTASADLAEQLAHELGAPLTGEQHAVERVVAERNGTAEDESALTESSPDRTAGTWHEGWTSASLAPCNDVLFEAGDDNGEQGALFS